ncbi:MAG: hypothetical protein ACYS47_08645, partial [Planctomycetota bacterium]
GEDAEGTGWLGNVLTGLNPRRCAALEKRRDVTTPECMECELRTRCRNWCACTNHFLTGRFDRVSPLVCFHERMAIEIADRTASRLFTDKNEVFLREFYQEKPVEAEWV